MIRAGSPLRSEPFQGLAAHEFQHRSAIVEVSDLARRRGDETADGDHEIRSDLAPLRLGQHGSNDSSERLPALTFLPQPGYRAIDDVERVVVARLCGISPGEQAVRFQNYAARLGIVLDELPQSQSQLVPRAYPGQPPDLSAVDFPCQGLAVGRCRDRDDFVRMHVIHVCPVDQPMQRRIDAGGAGVQVEGAVLIQRHQRAVAIRPFVEGIQGAELVEVEGSEPIQAHRAQVAARALHPQHVHFGPAQRVCGLELRRGVATTEVRDPAVGTQQVRSIQQQLRLRESRRGRVVPAVLYEGGRRSLRRIARAHCRFLGSIVRGPATPPPSA